jgi:acyl-CoA synthetase (AMP-forming)/AMP-acid ligase II
VAEAVPLGQVLTRLAQADPGRPAITSAGQTITRAGLEARANRLARGYESHGARPGDLVTVALPNGIEFYAAVFALWKLGAIPQLMSPALPARERDAILALAAPSLVIGAGPAAANGTVQLPLGYTPDPGLSDAPIEPPRVSPSWKVPTSGGSTGRPELIVSGLRGEIDPGYYGEVLGQRDGGVQLVCGPLRAVWHGAAPCPAWLKRAWISLVGARNLHEMYGTTEGQMMTHIDGIEWLAHPGSVGRPVWGEVKILAPDGTELAPGADDELRAFLGETPSPSTSPLPFLLHQSPVLRQRGRLQRCWRLVIPADISLD